MADQSGGQRPPFEPGHELSVRHGAYATKVKLGPRVDELATQLRELVPNYGRADEPAVQLLALIFARLEASSEAFEGRGLDELMRLRDDEKGWINRGRQLMVELGLTPAARVRLELDAARTKELLDPREVRQVVIVAFTTAGRFVPPPQREAFLAAMDEQLSVLPAGGEVGERAGESVEAPPSLTASAERSEEGSRLPATRAALDAQQTPDRVRRSRA